MHKVSKSRIDNGKKRQFTDYFSPENSFVPAGTYNESNMAVMEVQFPSGFTADLDTLPSLEVSENVKKVETKDGDTVVVIYFEHIGRKEICPTLDAFRTHKVAMQKPAAVTLYDYYDNCTSFSTSLSRIKN